MSDEVRVVDNPAEHRYEVYLGEERAGFVTYRLERNHITFVHTEVDDRFEGHGLAHRLAHEALTDVRVRWLRVIAQCPFIKRYIAEHPEYQDLLA